MSSRTTEPRQNARSGVALVMVLWLMTVLSAVALQVGLLSRLRLQVTRNIGDGMRALFLARAGVERAVADLRARRDGVVALSDLREDELRAYRAQPLSGGSYTLVAEPRQPGAGELEYGISDESAKLNLNYADAEALRKLPGLDADLAAAIVALREEREQIYEFEDLLLIGALDRLALYGEDQNGNGILDPSEDDGDETWPRDDADGRLAPGLAAYLTCVSAVRNVAANGAERVDINKATQQELKKGLPDLTDEQALSIVEHRKKAEFKNVAELLDVRLVEKKEEGGGSEKKEGGGRNERGGRQAGESGGRPKRSGGGPQGGKKDEGGDGDSGTRTTDKNAFDESKFKELADLVTVTEDKVLHGLVNVNTAPVEVLACLPEVGEPLARAIADRRRQEPFRSAADLLDLEGMSTDKFKKLCNLVAVRSDVFSVRSFGVVGGDEAPVETYCGVRAVIDRTGERIALTSWRELR